MPFDEHRHRQSIRLRGYDYAQPGIYFVTICTHSRQRLFDDAHIRRIAERQWESLPHRCNFITLDAWIVMPDHMHGLLRINERDVQPEGENHHRANVPDKQAPDTSVRGLKAHSLGAVILTYKSIVIRNIHAHGMLVGLPVWQRGYWERIIRNDEELNATRRYIINNPQREQDERDDLDALFTRMKYHEQR